MSSIQRAGVRSSVSVKKMSDINSIFTTSNGLLESPRWDVHNGWIWFVSINDRQIIALDLGGRINVSYMTRAEVSFVHPLDKSCVLYADATGIYRLNHANQLSTQLFPGRLPLGFRFNDAAIDDRGRIIIGVKVISDSDNRLGCLLSIDESGKVLSLIDSIKIPNGLAFDNSMSVLYFCESSSHAIYQYNYDLENGTMVGLGKLIEFPISVYPDGICLGEHDDLWVAEWGGGAVSCWDVKSGQRLHRIRFPVSKISSCTIGGAERDHLFVTSAHEASDPVTGAAHVFICKL